MTGDAYLGFEGFWDLQVEEHGLNQQVDVQPPPREFRWQLLECVWKRGGQTSGKQMKSCQVIISPKKIFFPLISLYGNIDGFWLVPPNLSLSFSLFHNPSFPFSVDCTGTSH